MTAKRQRQLLDLAKDVRESMGCRCYTDDLEGPCPCGGSGRAPDGNDDPFMGCFHCQASVALGLKPVM
jgi:hypothetical protein